jgi:hypothetical protein
MGLHDIVLNIITTRYITKALFTSPVFSPPKDVGICGDLVFTQYSQIPSNTLPKKILYHDEEFLI